MTESNGHDISNAEATAIDDIKAMAGQIKSSAVVERVREDCLPFDQATHTLMMESVDRITQQWVGELNHVRDNTKVVEQMVISQAARAKDELTKLHLLGVQAMKEAARGQEVVRHLGDELDAMMSEHAQTH
jgi:hypothetical protein